MIKKYQDANKEIYSENNEENNMGMEARFTKVLREKRSNKNGLLLIYPILPMDYKSVPRLGENNDPISDFNNSWNKFKENFKSKKDENLLKKIKERKAIISIAVSFPKTSEDLATNVYVNNVYVKLREEEEGRED